MSRRLAILTRGLRGGRGGSAVVVAPDVIVISEPRIDVISISEPTIQEVILIDGQTQNGKPISVRRGDTWGIPVSIYADEAQTTEPSDINSSRLTLTMKQNIDDAVPVFQQTIEIDAATPRPFVFGPSEAQSKALEVWTYHADIERRTDAGLVVTPWRGAIQVKDDITTNL